MSSGCYASMEVLGGSGERSQTLVLARTIDTRSNSPRQTRLGLRGAQPPSAGSSLNCRGEGRGSLTGEPEAESALQLSAAPCLATALADESSSSRGAPYEV